MAEARPVAYHAHDFVFDDWRREVEREVLVDGEGSESESGSGRTWDRSSHKQAEAWEIFYEMHHGGDFFKERRYLHVEFHELAANDAATAPIAVLELGCGNGSSVLAVLRANAAAVVYACDFSESAVRLMQANVAAAAIPDGSARCVGFVCDVASQQVHQHLAEAVAIAEQAVAAEVEGGGECGEAAAAPPLPALRTQMDYVLMVFVLSAVCPTRAVTFLRNACAPLRPGGIVLFRDYGLYDLTMLRFPASQLIDATHRLYARQDGTLSRMLTKEDMQQLCADAGLTLVECEYHTVLVTNRKKGLVMRRVFLHAKLQKPA